LKNQPSPFAGICVPQLGTNVPKAELAKASPASCTLKTANKTVGSLLSVALTVQDNRVFDMMHEVGTRQQQCCLTFPVTLSSTPTSAVLCEVKPCVTFIELAFVCVFMHVCIVPRICRWKQDVHGDQQHCIHGVATKARLLQSQVADNG
jgi:hypothetical protein